MINCSHPVTFGSLEQVIPHREIVPGFMNSGLFCFFNWSRYKVKLLYVQVIYL